MNYFFSLLSRLLLLFLMVVVAGCSNPVRNTPLNWSVNDVDESRQDEQAEEQVEKNPVSVSSKRTIELQKGTDQYIQSEAGTKQNKVEDGIHLNFNNVDLQAFIQTVLGDVLKQNYLIDPKVQGKVTIQTLNPLPEDELLDILQEVLELNGATLLLKDSGYRVVPVSAAKQSPLVPRVKQLKRQGYSLQILPLRYISVVEMEQVLRPSLTGENILYVDQRRNLLIIKGTEEELSRIVDMIAIFDVHWMEGKSISLFPLEHVEAKEVVSELTQALDGKNGNIFNGLVKLIPIERINSVLVVSHTRDYMQDIVKWIKRFDIADHKVGKRLYVYFLKNAKAVDIAETLNNIFDDSSTKSQQTSDSVVNPSDTAVTISQKGDASPDSQPSTALAQNHLVTASTGIQLFDTSAIRVIADENNNSLVIMCTPYEYELVKSAVEQLDILPKQVLIEVTILEVTLTGDLSYGVEWFFKNGGIDSNKVGQGQLSLGSDGISKISPGFSYSLVDQLGDVRAVFNALESESDVRILSSPSILVMDNSSAEISVGDEVPIPTSQSTSNTDSSAPTVNKIEYRDTGILLSVSPRINTGGLVTLEVNQEVSDAVTTRSSGIDAPTISQRSIKTTVAIQDGESVLLGGLIRGQQEDSRSGLPGVSRIPVIGGLFSQSTNTDRKSELLMILTPRVIDNVAEAKELTNEYRQKLLPEFSSMISSVLESVDE